MVCICIKGNYSIIIFLPLPHLFFFVSLILFHNSSIGSTDFRRVWNKLKQEYGQSLGPVEFNGKIPVVLNVGQHEIQFWKKENKQFKAAWN